MVRKKKPTIPIRTGKPSNCVSCGKPIHRKSEYYCSAGCADAYQKSVGDDAPAFLSKWKVRKRKQLEDPLIALRQKVRRKTRELIKSGVLRRGVCTVCGNRDVVPHHEDYRDPFNVIWLCEDHHKEYHDGKIALFGGKLRWDPKRLIEVGANVGYPKKKYRILREITNRKAPQPRSSG
jgi:hypothetical protein